MLVVALILRPITYAVCYIDKPIFSGNSTACATRSSSAVFAVRLNAAQCQNVDVEIHLKPRKGKFMNIMTETNPCGITLGINLAKNIFAIYRV